MTGNTQLAANTSYTVQTPASTVTLTLPPSTAVTVGDTVTISGTSATTWVLAQNTDQYVLTTGLNGNVPAGTTWTPRLSPRVWHWISSDSTGDALLAGEAGGVLNTSRDAGQTWTSGNSPSGIWISSDMSARGELMVALQYGGGMYTSTDFGVTWARVMDPLVNDAAGLAYESVTVSADGQHIAATIQPTPGTTPNGRLVFSNDAGRTWSVASLPAGTYFWRAIDSSADGQVIVAVSHNGEVFLLANAGASWSPLTVQLTTAGGSTAFAESWYRVKLSADGNTIALAANSFGGAPGSGIFVSRDRGATWTRNFTLTADYTALAISSDGRTIAASISNTATGGATTPGRVVISTDAGPGFAALTLPGTDTDWRALAMASDATRIAVAAGRFTTSAAGQLYTTSGGRTSTGAAGSVVGNQNASVTLRYLGNGVWSVQAAAGGPFTVR